MRHPLDALKTRVSRTEDKTKNDFQRKVAENEQLITECNALRKESRELKVQLDKVNNELRNGRPSAGGASTPPPTLGPVDESSNAVSRRVRAALCLMFVTCLC